MLAIVEKSESFEELIKNANMTVDAVANWSLSTEEGAALEPENKSFKNSPTPKYISHITLI